MPSALAGGTRTAKRIPLDVAEGDTVIYSKYGGTEIKYNGEEYLILSARDVLAVVSSSRACSAPAIPVLTTGDFRGGMR